MDSVKQSAAKQSKPLRNHIRTSLFRRFEPSHHLVSECSCAQSGRKFDDFNDVRSISQDRQASQQKSCIEVAAIDAPVDDWSTPSDTSGIQGFSQLAVAPAALHHSPLNQAFRLEPPFVDNQRLRFDQTGVCIGRKWAPLGSIHLLTRHFLDELKRQLKSILTQRNSSYLYVCPNYLEAISNA